MSIATKTGDGGRDVTHVWPACVQDGCARRRLWVRGRTDGGARIGSGVVDERLHQGTDPRGAKGAHYRHGRAGDDARRFGAIHEGWISAHHLGAWSIASVLSSPRWRRIKNSIPRIGSFPETRPRRPASILPERPAGEPNEKWRLSVEARRTSNPEILRYLNRLSDFCWLLARYAERHPAGERA